MVKPWLSFISLLPFVVGSMAKPRGVRGGGGSGDGWDAPGTVKATLAFHIIYFFLFIGEFVVIVRGMRFVPPGRRTRAPYFLLAVVTGVLVVTYFLLAVWTRISTQVGRAGTTSFANVHGLRSVVYFLLSIDNAFRPGVCLWLVHLRGDLAQITGTTTKPWISQVWKRITDWSLVTILFLLGISEAAVLTNTWVLANAHQLTSAEYQAHRNTERGFHFAWVAFVIILNIDIAISFIALKASQRGNFIDPISTRLLVAVLPVVVLDSLETLVVSIYRDTHKISEYDPRALDLVVTILAGAIRVGIIWGLLSTMRIPNVIWTPGPAAPGLGYLPQPPQPPQQSFYQPAWQYSPPIVAPGQNPHPLQYQPPQNLQATYAIPK